MECSCNSDKGLGLEMRIEFWRGTLAGRSHVKNREEEITLSVVLWR
jgi:hypothetical protein